MKDRSEYFRQYMLERYHSRRQDAINRLGGVCVKCGSNEDLEFDHINPNDKSFTLGGGSWNVSQEKWDVEVDKCQLLCKRCHKEKTQDESPKRYYTVLKSCIICDDTFIDRFKYAAHVRWCNGP